MKKNNLTLSILKAIDRGFDILELLEMTQRHQKVFMIEGFEGLRRLKRKKQQREIKLRLAYLKRKKFIQITRQGNRLISALTNKGKVKIFRTQLQNVSNHKDGTVTLVIFDIPESERTSREFLRRFLKDLNFKQLQKSVWISKKDFGNQLANFFRKHKLNGWINVFVGQFRLPEKLKL